MFMFLNHNFLTRYIIATRFRERMENIAHVSLTSDKIKNHILSRKCKIMSVSHDVIILMYDIMFCT